MAKIENRIDFEEWLKAQPRKVVEVMAIRIALRLIPLFLGNYPIGTVREVKPLPGLLPIFRSLAVGFAAATYPDSNPIIRLVGSLAVADLKRWNESLLGLLSTLRSESNAGLPNVAAYPLNVGYATDASVHCLLYTDQNALSHVRAAASSACGNADRISTFGELSIWAAISEDAIAIENGLTTQKLVASKLWPQTIWPANLPNEFSRLWSYLRIDLGDVGQDWDVWTDWYEARLAGKKPRWKDIEIFRVTLSDEAAIATAKDIRSKNWSAVLKVHEIDWENGPAHVNALIKAKINEKRSAYWHKRRAPTIALGKMFLEMNEYVDVLAQSNKPPSQIPKPVAKSVLGQFVVQNSVELVEKIELLKEAIELRREDLESHKPNEEIDQAAWTSEHEAIIDLATRVRALEKAVEEFLNCGGSEDTIEPEAISLGNSVKAWWRRHDQEVINSGWRFTRKASKLGVIVASAGVGAMFGMGYVTAPVAIAIIGGDRLIDQMKKIKMPATKA